MERQSTLKVLHLPIKKKWFDMIASGEKKEEYREIKPYWYRRFVFNGKDALVIEGCEKMKDLKSAARYNFDNYNYAKHFDFICFRNGYQKDAPELWVGCKGIKIGTSKPEWSDNWQGEVFVISLGEILASPIVL